MSVNARVIAGMAIVMATLSAVLYAQPAEDDSVGLPALLRAEPAEADADYLAQIEHLKDLQSPAEKRLAGEVPGGFAGITARIKGALGGPQVPRAVHMEDILAAASGLARDGKAPLVIVEGLQVPGNDGVIESVLTPRDEEGLRLKVQCEEGVSMPPLPAAGEEPRPSPVLVIGRVKLPDPTAVDPSPTPYVLASIIMPAPGGLALRRAALYEANAQVKAPADVARRMNELWDHLGMPRKERQRVREEIRAGKSTWTRELRTLLNVAAVEAYAAFAKQHGEHELAAEGLYRAARIAHKTLGDTGRAGKLYSDAWLRYVEQGRKGGRTYYVCEQTDEGLRRASVADAVGPPMDQLNSRHILYMIMDVFTTMCGGSAGWGVIALAVITRLLIWPLTQKQLRSTREMQAVAPEIKKLQEKHKGDRQTQQRQIMALYKERGVNPLGGCLPLLIQMPILIALYKGIRMYIYRFSDQEFLWVRSGIAWTGDNLAQPDMLLLVLYTISMILFQKFTAKSTPATDPQQQQMQQTMTYMMPIMFFFFFQNFPAAFILYWLGTNVIFSLHQYLFNLSYHREQPVRLRQVVGGALGSMPSWGGARGKQQEGARQNPRQRGAEEPEGAGAGAETESAGGATDSAAVSSSKRKRRRRRRPSRRRGRKPQAGDGE